MVQGDDRLLVHVLAHQRAGARVDAELARDEDHLARDRRRRPGCTGAPATGAGACSVRMRPHAPQPTCGPGHPRRPSRPSPGRSSRRRRGRPRPPAPRRRARAVTASAKCSRRPAPPEAITGTGAASATAASSSQSKPSLVPSRSMLVSSTSPAPRAAASAAHATASRPVGSRPPLRKTSQPVPSLAPLGVDRDHDALRAEAGRGPLDQAPGRARRPSSATPCRRRRPAPRGCRPPSAARRRS